MDLVFVTIVSLLSVKIAQSVFAESAKDRLTYDSETYFATSPSTVRIFRRLLGWSRRHRCGVGIIEAVVEGTYGSVGDSIFYYAVTVV